MGVQPLIQLHLAAFGSKAAYPSPDREKVKGTALLSWPGRQLEAVPREKPLIEFVRYFALTPDIPQQKSAPTNVDGALFNALR